MDDATLAARITAWAHAVEHVQMVIEAKTGRRPSGPMIQEAACERLQIVRYTDLVNWKWTGESLLDLLGGIDIHAWMDVETVQLEQSILPNDVPRRADEEQIKFRGEIWVIYKYDVDPFPFLPHAHCEYEGIKMDLRDGSLYRKRRYLSQISRKQLLAFRQRVKRIPLPPLSV